MDLTFLKELNLGMFKSRVLFKDAFLVKCNIDTYGR